mgnify:CR=1 FL=1
MELISRFFKTPAESFFLFGPRGTGKSTWAQAMFPDAFCFDLLEPATFRTFQSRPEHLRELLMGQPNKKNVILDEIQRIPALLSAIHSLIEEKRGWRFILTGSSARKLKRTGVDLLAGRAVRRTLHPFMASELGARFRLEDALKLGLIPLVVESSNPADTLAGYAALYLREEVQAEGLTRNLGNFSRFLEAVSFSHASVINLSNVARECEVERKTVEGYIGILEDLLLAWRLPVFTRRAKRALAVHPKFYFFDAGVFRSLRPAGPLDRPEEAEGQALEGLVAQHLAAWNAYSGEKHQLFFWRTRSGVEVDFVVYGPDGIRAIEVKHAARIQPKDLTGLRAFREDYPNCQALLLYRGKDRFVRDGITVMPCEDFLKELRPDRPV